MYGLITRRSGCSYCYHSYKGLFIELHPDLLLSLIKFDCDWNGLLSLLRFWLSSSLVFWGKFTFTSLLPCFGIATCHLLHFLCTFTSSPASLLRMLDFLELIMVSPIYLRAICLSSASIYFSYSGISSLLPSKESVKWWAFFFPSFSSLFLLVSLTSYLQVP